MSSIFGPGDGTTPYATTALNHLLAEQGLTAPSSRAIAAAARMSAASLSAFYDGRSAMLAKCAFRASDLQAWCLRQSTAERGWAGLIPVDDKELASERAWACWRALAIGEPVVRTAVADGVAAEESIIRTELALAAGSDVPADAAVALRCWLIERLVRRDSALSLAEAAERWAGFLTGLSRPNEQTSVHSTGGLEQTSAHPGAAP